MQSWKKSFTFQCATKDVLLHSAYRYEEHILAKEWLISLGQEKPEVKSTEACGRNPLSGELSMKPLE